MTYFSDIREGLISKFGEEMVNPLRIYQLHHLFWQDETPPIINYGTTTLDNLRAIKVEIEYLKQGLKKLGVKKATIDGVEVLLEDVKIKQLGTFIENCEFIQEIPTKLTIYQTSFCRYNKLYVKLTTENGTPIPNQELLLNNSSNQLSDTDVNGVSSKTYTTKGTYSVNISFEGTQVGSTLYLPSTVTSNLTVSDFSSTKYVGANATNVNSWGDTSYKGSYYHAWDTLTGSGTNVCGTKSSSICSDKNPRLPRPLKIYNFKAGTKSDKTPYPTIPSNATIYSVKVNWSDSVWNWESDNITGSVGSLSSTTSQMKLVNYYSTSNENYSDSKVPQWRKSTSHSKTYTSKELGGSNVDKFSTDNFTNKKVWVFLWWGANNSNNYVRLKCSSVSLDIVYKPYQAPMT